MPPDESNDRGREFARLLREARQAKGLTQDAVVAMSGVSRSTLLRWEGGRADRPDPEQVRAICLALHIDPREAAIALGYLRREELDIPAPSPPRRLDPSIQEVIEILEDPTVSAQEKASWVSYLRYLREHSRQPNNGRGRVAG